MAYPRDINVLSESSGITDEEVIEEYEGKIPGLSLDLVGNPVLNDMIHKYQHEKNYNAIRKRLISEGITSEEAEKTAKERADILLENALISYEALKKYRKTVK